LHYFEQAKHLWKTYVPKSGQANTVQGELIRAVEKLRDEAQRNGNGNWDVGFEILSDFLTQTLCDTSVFSSDQIQRIRETISQLRIPDEPCLQDDLFDELTDWVVEWYLKHPDPIPLAPNPKLYR
jgi:hypothetical protein